MGDKVRDKVGDKMRDKGGGQARRQSEGENGRLSKTNAQLKRPLSLNFFEPPRRHP